MERRYEISARFQLPWYDSLIVASLLLQSRVSVGFFTAKTFRMDSRLEASRSLTLCLTEKISLGISNRWGKKTTAQREHPASLGGCNHPNLLFLSLDWNWSAKLITISAGSCAVLLFWKLILNEAY